MTIQIEMKWQVFVVSTVMTKGNNPYKSRHTFWQYDSLEEAEEQYDLIDPKADRKELQQVLILKKDKRKGKSIFSQEKK